MFDIFILEMHQPDMTTKLTEELKSQLKKEGIDTDQPIRIKHHDKDKLKFLEGLGLVTLEKKKGRFPSCHLCVVLDEFNV